MAPTASELRAFVIGRIAGLVGVVALLALIAVPAAQAQSITTISTAAGVQFSGVVDSSPECTSAPTSVTISWGDGNSSAGTYDPTNNDVTGSHTYAAQGSFSGSVSFSGGVNCETDTLTANVAVAPQFTQCPPVDADFGCQFLIDVSASGTTIQQDPNQGPYETSDDALIGIKNDSSDPISAIPLSSPGSDLFGFDGDGICTPGAPPVPSGCVPAPGSPAGTTCNGPSTCAFPAPPGEPAGYTEPGAPSGSTQNGYEGPTTWFSNVSPDTSTGQVNFSPALLPGQSTFFSLEEPPSLMTLAAGSTPQGATLSAPPTVTSTAASFSGLVNPNGSPTTAYFQYGLDARYSTVGASGPVYDQSAPEQPESVGADFANHSVSASVSGLVPNALYHVRLVATNKSGTTFGPDQTFMTKQDPPPRPPTLGKTFDVKPVSGLVLIKLPGGKAADLTAGAALTKGQGFIPLTEARQLPTGTQVDSRTGTLQLVAASTRHGKTQTGTFGGAIFAIAQARTGLLKGLTTLSLLEGAFTGAPSYASCPKAESDDATARTAKASPKVLQTLKASDNHGSFRTTGRYSSASVLGTVWTITDRCDGTLTRVQRGTVIVTDFANRKTITLHAGQSFLARAITKKRS